MNSTHNQIFQDLFVLEMANNHWGSLERGLKIIHDFAAVVRANSVKAAIKLQFRDVDNFVHPLYKGSSESRYISKTERTRISQSTFETFVDQIRHCGCIPMATPFDESSVDLCKYFDLPIIKIASSDVNTWPLLEKVAQLKKPVIISTGGASEVCLDDCVRFFKNRSISLAINHCVSLYPTEDSELELNQIDYLKTRYPDNVIGFSTHEYSDWHSSMLISFAKGARTWERHIDIQTEDKDVSPYCSLPHQIDKWFKTYHLAREMCGNTFSQRRIISSREKVYLDELVRGVYAKKDIPQGYIFSSETFNDDFYLAIPLHKGQLSCREVINGLKLIRPVVKDDLVTLDHIDGPYNEDPYLRTTISSRGIEPSQALIHRSLYQE